MPLQHSHIVGDARAGLMNAIELCEDKGSRLMSWCGCGYECNQDHDGSSLPDD